MIPGDPYRSDDVEVREIPEVEPDADLDEEALEKLTKDFGKGSVRRTMLVSKGVTLTDLHKMSK